jgi:hypothetical protein
MARLTRKSRALRVHMFRIKSNRIRYSVMSRMMLPWFQRGYVRARQNVPGLFLKPR